MKSTKKTNDDDEYKDESSKHQHGNESVINKTKEEQVFLKRLMSMNFKQNVIQYVIDIVTSCEKKRYNWEKNKNYQAKINGKHLLLFH